MYFKKSLVVFACIISIFSLPTCNKKSSDPGNSSSVKNDLVFERSDGTQVEFKPKAFVWCGPWEGDEIPIETLHILAGFDPADQQGTANWMLKAVISDVKIGEEMTFPNTFIWNQPEGVSIYVYDPPNELSTQEEESNGWIIFQKLACGANGEVEFSIDAVIGSEFHLGDSLRVSGTFYAPITGSMFSK